MFRLSRARGCKNWKKEVFSLTTIFSEPFDLFRTSPRERAIADLHEATALYTIEPVVMDLLDCLPWPDGDKKLLDAGAGGGNFLKEAIRRLLEAEPDITPDRLCHLVEGWEIYPLAVEEARRGIASLLCSHGWSSPVAARTADCLVVNGDFLTSYPGRGTVDVIAGNPPFLRYANLAELLRLEYEECVPAFAQKDLLYSFLNRCVEALSPDGILGLICSDRWLFNSGAAGLREVLGRRIGIESIKRLDSSSFYRPKDRRAGTPPRVHPVAVVMKTGEAKISLGREAIYPDAADSRTSGALTLADIASVRICPWLGKEGVFVVDAATAERLPGEYLVPAVDTDDIRDGVLQKPTRYAIRTFPGVEPPQEIVRHLRGALHRLSATGRRRKDWWLPPETWHNMPLDQEAFLIPRIAKGLRYVKLPALHLGINHNLSIIAPTPEKMLQVEAVLNSDEAQEWVRNRAPRLENGFLSITTSFLRQLPLPGR